MGRHALENIEGKLSFLCGYNLKVAIALCAESSGIGASEFIRKTLIDKCRMDLSKGAWKKFDPEVTSRTTRQAALEQYLSSHRTNDQLRKALTSAVGRENLLSIAVRELNSDIGKFSHARKNTSLDPDVIAALWEAEDILTFVRDSLRKETLGNARVTKLRKFIARLPPSLKAELEVALFTLRASTPKTSPGEP